ncbi:NAD-dependent epimerase/dehydratase family protein [Streptomyces sp. NBC_00433]
MVLVTGVSGLIGGHIAAELLRRGYAVRGSVRSPSRIGRREGARRLRGPACDRAPLFTVPPADQWVSSCGGRAAGRRHRARTGRPGR